MPSARKTNLTTYRRQLKRRGVVRLEVQVQKDDATLVRGVVKALRDPDRAGAARALLREHFSADDGAGLKALLAAAPLDGIDLTREPSIDRNVVL
jgi:hypothetical protein